MMLTILLSISVGLTIILNVYRDVLTKVWTVNYSMILTILLSILLLTIIIFNVCALKFLFCGNKVPTYIFYAYLAVYIVIYMKLLLLKLPSLKEWEYPARS